MIKPSKNKYSLFQTASIIIGLTAALITGEILLRFFGIGYGHAPLVSDGILHHRHPRNYVFTVHHPSGEYGGHKMYYDKDGLVADPESAGKAGTSNSIQRLAFMGDSFIEATQVPYLKSFVGRLHMSCKENIAVKNYGVTSYSPALYLLQWETMVCRFKPTHVFLMLNSGDIEDDKCYAEKALYSADKKIIAVPGPGNDWWKIQLRKFYIVRLIRKVWLQLKWNLTDCNKKPPLIIGNYVKRDPDISELSAAYILKLANKIQNFGSNFTLMIVPSKYRLQTNKYDTVNFEFSDKWKEWAKRYGIDFLDLVPPFRYASTDGTKLYFDYDVHFNSKGHKVIAQVIRKSYPEYFRGETLP